MTIVSFNISLILTKSLGSFKQFSKFIYTNIHTHKLRHDVVVKLEATMLILDD